tara:strand:+ start:1809 stop:2048 length:240 start_codon:yes stop_codon:yes gene_type:complete
MRRQPLRFSDIDGTEFLISMTDLIYVTRKRVPIGDGSFLAELKFEFRQSMPLAVTFSTHKKGADVYEQVADYLFEQAWE